MKFKLEIDMDNDAFDDDNLELGRILEVISTVVLWHAGDLATQRVLDINGNVVGEWSFNE